MKTLVQIVEQASVEANRHELLRNKPEKDRTAYSILASVTSELGELAEEVAINQGQSYKQRGADGVLGEAIDVIVAALDLITFVYPEVTEEQINTIAKRKCDKWLSKLDK